MEVQGYPQFVIFAVLGIGIPLAFFRPYAAFLFAVLLLTAGHFHMFNKTRLPGLGPYLNLYDVCVLVALTGFFFDRIAGRKPVRLPQIVALVLFVLLIAGGQTVWRFGWTYQTQSYLRMVLDFPIAFFLGANLVDSPDRARKLVGTLLAAALLAAVQHVLFVTHIWVTKSLSIANYDWMRTIGYWAGCLPSAFLLLALVWEVPRGLTRKALWVAAGVLLLATLFLNQTRSLWIATACAVPVLVVLLHGTSWTRVSARLAVSGAVVVLLLGVLCQRLVPGLSLGVVVKDRLGSLLAHDDMRSGTASRERAFRYEMASWAEGTLILGRGLCFFQAVEKPLDESQEIAVAHLGYVTYLSQLGLVGLLVYGWLLPVSIVRNGLWLWRQGREPALRFLGGLGTASIVCLSIMFIMSSHFLGFTYFAVGALYGALWALVRLDPGSEDGREEFPAAVPEPARA
jgi:hypothetical protein